jgi:hypothetical protein
MRMALVDRGAGAAAETVVGCVWCGHSSIRMGEPRGSEVGGCGLGGVLLPGGREAADGCEEGSGRRGWGRVDLGDMAIRGGCQGNGRRGDCFGVRRLPLLGQGRYRLKGGRTREAEQGEAAYPLTFFIVVEIEMNGESTK